MVSGRIFFESISFYKKPEKFITEHFTISAPKYVLNNEGPKIFFICHKGNWEGVFLYASIINICHSAVARALPNQAMQDWITSKRSRFGSKIITKTNGIKEMISTLRNGESLGLVADQSYPESSYHSSLFGTRTYSVQTPALLARKLKVPIFFNDTYYANGKWHLKMYGPYASDPYLSKEEDLKQMMDKLLQKQEETIKEHVTEWMWYHQRWKQGGYAHLPKFLRWDQILVILPEQIDDFDSYHSLIQKIRNHYPKSFLSVLCPIKFAEKLQIHNLCVYTYNFAKECYIDSYVFQAIFNFSEDINLSKHYLKRGAHISFNKDSFQNSTFFK